MRRRCHYARTLLKVRTQVISGETVRQMHGCYNSIPHRREFDGRKVQMLENHICTARSLFDGKIHTAYYCCDISAFGMRRRGLLAAGKVEQSKQRCNSIMYKYEFENRQCITHHSHLVHMVSPRELQNAIRLFHPCWVPPLKWSQLSLEVRCRGVYTKPELVDSSL
jgi:hypothetical protein